MICPICNNKELQPTDAFCPSCGYEIHIYPNGSKALDEYERKRAERYKETWKALNNNNNTIHALQRQIDELKSTMVRPIAYLVMSQEGNITAIYNVLEGENSFGYKASNGRHQQIICNAQISDVHFNIRAISAADAKGRTRTKFFVAPRDGEIFGSSNCSNIINSERELEKNESVYIDDIKFTLVANKS